MPQHRSYSFGEYTLDLRRGSLLRAGADVRLRPKSFNVLRLLIERHGQLVTKDELISAVWGQLVVTEGSLTQCLMDVRRAIGDESQEIIRTVPRRGFIFDVPVVESGVSAQADAQAPTVSASSEPQARRRSWRGATVLAAVAALSAVAIWWGVSIKPGATQAPHYSIAVLPFVDMSAGHDHGYLADGLSEEILNRLAQSQELRVIARTSSFALRDQPLEVPEIAARLDVSHVLEGSVRRSGNHVRITAQLIAASSNAHVWSETYDRELGDLFAVQDEIAASIAAALDVTLAGGPPQEQMPASAAAYASYLQGKFFYERRAPGDFERAVKYFEEAVALDPGYARAWAALAGAYSFMVEPGKPSAEAWRARQGQAARKAVELNPSLAMAHLRLSMYYSETSDFKRADEHWRKALALDPDDLLVMGGLASHAMERGDLDEAIAVERRVTARDPLSPMAREILATFLLASGRLDEAMSEYRKVLDLNPDAGPEVRADIATILILQRRYEEAWPIVAQLADGKFRDYGLALLYQAPGHASEAQAALERLSARSGDLGDSIRLAGVYTFRGMHDEAFASLQRQQDALKRDQATASEWVSYFHGQMRLSPFLGSLHADPRWAALFADPGQ